MKVNDNIPVINFGLNTDKYDGKIWDDKVQEFKNAVKERGTARASWSCTGRTRHMIQAQMLAEACPEFDFTITYDTYECTAHLRGN